MIDLDALQQRVQLEIEHYQPTPHPGAIGTPLPPQWFDVGLAEMRAALVSPYFIHAIDEEEQVCRRVAVVADDGKWCVAFDPKDAGEFVLLGRRDDKLIIANWMRGDAVGCFLSR